MIRVYLADAIRTERLALRLILLDLKMEVVGEADNWSTTLAEVPVGHTDMLVVDWGLLPNEAIPALNELRRACPKVLVVTLISHLNARQHAAVSAGADMIISKDELPERVAERLQAAAKIITGYK